jgi:phospholipid/cholesterol/gamma-HCH transport system permease protein
MVFIIKNIGSSVIEFANKVGKISIFIFEVLINLFSKKYYFKQIIKQFIEVGFYSLPVVGLTAIFTGAVLALQSYSGFSRFSAESAIATVVVLSITRELGPVLASLMVAGRVGASIAAEIATMRVSEQIDALKILSTNPIKYLVIPRMLALVFMLPVLVLLSDIIGVMGGYLVSVYSLDFNATIYLQNTSKYLKSWDVIQGLIKSSVFGFIIAIISSYFGYNSEKGAQGVGSATTSSVVLSSILILLSNYLLTQLFF